MNKHLKIALFGALILSGCATKQPDLSKLPIVTQGTKEAQNKKDAIIKIPAGSNMTLKLRVTSDFFENNVTKNIPITLNQDVYVYYLRKKITSPDDVLISFDKKIWKTYGKAFKGCVNFGVAADKSSTELYMYWDSARYDTKRKSRCFDQAN